MVERFLLTLQGKRLVIDLEDRGIFLLNPFIVLLNQEVQSCFCETSFEALVFPLWWVSLLGKHRGGRF